MYIGLEPVHTTPYVSKAHITSYLCRNQTFKRGVGWDCPAKSAVIIFVHVAYDAIGPRACQLLSTWVVRVVA